MPPLISPLFPQTLSVATSIGTAAALSMPTILSIRDLKQKQARDNLVYLLSVASLTNSPPLVEAAVNRLSLITQLRTAKRADLEALLLPNGSAPSPNNFKDLISIARYSNHYVVALGYHITKTMWL